MSRINHRWVRIVARALSGGVVTFFVLGVVYLLMLRVSGNFNTVVPGELYRSGQLSTDQIASYVKRYGIRTIINLRGRNPGRSWYDGEIAETSRLDVVHIDFGMSSRQRLNSGQIEELLARMKNAAKPILIHCQAGADRSGLASALYLAAFKGASEPLAESQLSIRYGHFSLPFIPEYAMDQTFETFEVARSIGAPNMATFK